METRKNKVKKVKIYRSFDQTIKDLLYPEVGIFVNPNQSKRHSATAAVLQRIPPQWYKRLTELIDSFLWFIPHELVLGQTMPFPATVYPEVNKNSLQEKEYAQVIYLSPGLEAVSPDIAKAVVAHELAHLCLNHKLRCDDATYELQEAEAWQLICKWGFEKEFKKHKQFNKRREELSLRFCYSNNGS